MGIFSGIAAAPAPSGSGNYFAEGKYLVEVRRFAAGTSAKGDGDFVVAEVVVLEQIVPYEDSNSVGESISWIAMKKHAPFLSNVKGFLAAALECGVGDVSEDMADKATAGDGTALAGVRMVAEVHTIKTKRNNDFTKVSWFSAPE